MESIKVEGRLVNDSGDSRLRHKNRLIPMIIVILFSVVSIFGYREYINNQLNSEEFSTAHATIEQLSKKYGYVDEYSFTLEELIEAYDDVTDDILNKIDYLDRQDFSGEDYVKYIDVRDYYEYIMNLPYSLTMLSIVSTMFSLMYIVMFIKS